jgi:hypothetical protein
VDDDGVFGVDRKAFHRLLLWRVDRAMTFITPVEGTSKGIRPSKWASEAMAI